MSSPIKQYTFENPWSKTNFGQDFGQFGQGFGDFSSNIDLGNLNLSAPFGGSTVTNPLSMTPSTTGGGGGGLFPNMSTTQKASVAGGIGGILQGLFGRKKRRAAQRKAKKEYDKQRALYQALDTSNLAAGFKNQFAGMENTYEDLTVNQQQAEFEAQQGAQSRANIMQNLRGAAGGSGIAGLAQVMANQSQLATQRASATIGQQESANQRLASQGAARIQSMERQGEYQADLQRLKGAGAARDLEWQKQEMELGFAMQEKTAADKAIQDANAALYGGIGSLATTALTGGFSNLGAGLGAGGLKSIFGGK